MIVTFNSLQVCVLSIFRKMENNIPLEVKTQWLRAYYATDIHYWSLVNSFSLCVFVSCLYKEEVRLTISKRLLSSKHLLFYSQSVLQYMGSLPSFPVSMLCELLTVPFHWLHSVLLGDTRMLTLLAETVWHFSSCTARMGG